jgi:hypothetical protein
MSRFINQRRLTRVHRQLAQARDELAVVQQQLVALTDYADDARVRALVSDHPHDTVVGRDATKSAEAMSRSRDALIHSIARLEREQDDLLDRLVVEPR